MLTDEELRAALRRAFTLGQTYFQQADSLSHAENRRSDQTRAKFDLLVMETSIRHAAGVAPSDGSQR
jgi:hypothetical protein